MNGSGSPSSVPDKKFSLLFNGVDDASITYMLTILKKDESTERKQELLKSILGKDLAGNYDEWKKEMALSVPKEIIGPDIFHDDALVRLLTKLMEPATQKNFFSWCENLNQPDYWPNSYVFAEAKRILNGDSLNLHMEDGYVDVNKDIGLKPTSTSSWKPEADQQSTSLAARKQPTKTEFPVDKEKEDLSKQRYEEKKIIRGTKTADSGKGNKMRLLAKGIKSGEQREPTVPDSDSESQVGKKKKYKQQRHLSTVNVLLVGDSGVGKSTFINAISNYVEYSSLGDAIDNGPNVLINSKFTMENKMVTIKTDSTYETTIAERQNENLGSSGESVTQKPVTHSLFYKLRGKELNLNLIDTPGLNDTRGLEQDMKNLNQIREHILEIGHLNAIVILLEATSQKMTMQFRHSLNELLTHFDKNSLKNLIFCYTKSRTTNYKAGDAIITLREFIKEQTSRTGTNIELGRENIFFFDSECFRYLCMVSQFPACRSNAIDASLQECWEINVKEFERLLVRINQVESYKLANSTDLGKLKNKIQLLASSQQKVAQLLVNTDRNVQSVFSEMQVKYTRLEELYKKSGALKENVPLANPILYCNRCKQVCYKVDAEARTQHMETVDNTILIHFPNLFTPIGQSCKNCFCSYAFHGFLRSTVKQRKTSNTQNLKEIDGIDNAYEILQRHLMDRQKDQDILETEEKKLIQLCAEIQVHINCKSTTNTIDYFRMALLDFMQIEDVKVQSGTDRGVLEQLSKILKDYEEERRRISEEVENKAKNVLTEHEIETRLQEINTFQQTKQILQEIKREMADA